MNENAINWPAIIKHADDDELIYISSRADWDADEDVHNFEYSYEDMLIDSHGQVFKLTDKEASKLKPRACSEPMVLHDILGLVKAHAALKGSCCVAKIYAPTIADAYKIVQSLQD